jgi:UDP-2-acetamido-2,6-beta-L-arabino-hexul-4-ose reductase
VNTGLTSHILEELRGLNKRTPIVFSSSTQAALENDYGSSKKHAEDLLFRYGKETGAPVAVYRLTNVFGKWCRPNYNSVVATFCHNIANGLPITMSDSSARVKLVYVDDVIESFFRHLDGNEEHKNSILESGPVFEVTLQQLADLIYGFKAIRESLRIPAMDDAFQKRLYSTYLSYLPVNEFSYRPLEREDNRGRLVELLKSPASGQMFVSTTHAGITRGNHYHHTKVEKFIVVKGKAIIRFRKIDSEEVITCNVSDNPIEIVDIPPGYTHHIENAGEEDMIVLFWANEIFDPGKPDTHFLNV